MARGLIARWGDDDRMQWFALIDPQHEHANQSAWASETRQIVQETAVTIRAWKAGRRAARCRVRGKVDADVKAKGRDAGSEVR